MTIEGYHALFLLLLTITIFLFVLTAVLFFVFDMRKVIGIKTGWAVQRSIKRSKIVNQREEREKRIEAINRRQKENVGNGSKAVKSKQKGDVVNKSKTVNQNKKTLKTVDHEKKDKIALQYKKDEKERSLLSETVWLGRGGIESDESVTVDLKQVQTPEQGKFFQIFETKMVIDTDERIGGNML